MYKTIKVEGTEPAMYGEGTAHSDKLSEAIEKINCENGRIISINTTEIPNFRSYGVGFGYSEVELRTVIVYETT